MAPKRPKAQYPRRGEVYLVNFDPTVGSEIKKTRPALILQNDVANRYSPVTIVAAITSYYGGDLYPTEVLVQVPEGGLSGDSLIVLNQIRAIDKQRLSRRLGKLSTSALHRVGQAVEISLGLIEV